MAAGLVDRVQMTIFPVITGQTGLEPIFQWCAATSTGCRSRAGRSTVTSKSSSIDPPSIDRYGFADDPCCLHWKSHGGLRHSAPSRPHVRPGEPSRREPRAVARRAYGCRRHALAVPAGRSRMSTPVFRVRAPAVSALKIAVRLPGAPPLDRHRRRRACRRCLDHLRIGGRPGCAPGARGPAGLAVRIDAAAPGAEAGPDHGCWTWWGTSQSPQTCGAVARQLAPRRSRCTPTTPSSPWAPRSRCRTRWHWTGARISVHLLRHDERLAARARRRRLPRHRGPLRRLWLSADGARTARLPTPGTMPVTAVGETRTRPTPRPEARP